MTTTLEQVKAPEWTSRLQTRFVPLDDIEIVSRAKGGDGRTVVAYAALFDVQAEVRDQEGHYVEQIERGAFAKTLRERAGKIGVFYNHGQTLHGTPSERGSVPLGVPLEIREDDRGLLTVTRYSKTPLAEEVLEGIKDGSIRGQSFTGAFIKSSPARAPYWPSRDGRLTVVTRKETALREYGPTPIPVYDEPGMIVGVRSDVEDGRPRIVINLAGADVEVVDATRAAAVEAEDTEDAPDAVDEAVTSPESTAAAEGTAAAGTVETSGADEPPSVHSEPPPSNEETAVSENTNAAAAAVAEPASVETQRSTWTLDERRARVGEIQTRMAEIDAEFGASELPSSVEDEWNQLDAELVQHNRAIESAEARRARLAEIANDDRRIERVNVSGSSGRGRHAPNVQVNKPENIYDLAEARNRARSIEELPGEYRDFAMRAVEAGQYPGVSDLGNSRRSRDTREDAQTHVAELLDGPDAGRGDLARRIIATGSKIYERAFFKSIIRRNTLGLTSEEQRALTMGTLAVPGEAALPVPFQLDPTIILDSDGSINPLRQISRVETITGKAWQGVTSAHVTVLRTLEASRAPSDGAPDLAQPEVQPQAVHGFIPFTVESDEDWPQLRSEMTRLLNDGKEQEEASSFVTGNGSPPNPEGIITGLDVSQEVDVTMTSPTSDDVLFNVEESLGERFLPRARWLARRSTFNFIRSLGAESDGGDLWVRLGQGLPPELIGYPAHVASAVPAMAQGAKFLVFGDFMTGFLIVDKAGMGVELIPHLFTTGGGSGDPTFPIGQRGIYAIWRNSSKVIVPNAFRVAIGIT